MKIGIKAKLLVSCIEKSSVAALTKGAQSEERKKSSPIESCVKISATKDAISFESSSGNTSAIHVEKTNDEYCLVEEDGSICVDAKAYLGVLKTVDGDSQVDISFVPDKKEEKYSEAKAPNGKIVTVVSGQKSDKRKGKNDTFSVEGFGVIDYSCDKVVFSATAIVLKNCLERVAFATDATDFSGVYDKVAIAIANNKLYFAGTDGKRCAIFVEDKDAKIVGTENKNFYVNCASIKDSFDSFNDDEIVSFVDCETHVIISNADGSTKIKIGVASDEIKQKFPKFSAILGLAFPHEFTVGRKDLLTAIDFVGEYNEDKCVFNIDESGNNMRIDAARRGSDPENAVVTCENFSVKIANPISMSNYFVKDVLRKLKCEKVKMSFTSDEKKIKICCENDNNFIYFMQCMLLAN